MSAQTEPIPAMGRGLGVRQMCLENGRERSDRLLDQPGTQAAGADANTLVGAVDNCTHSLQVGVEDSPGPIIGVTDIIS